MIIPGDSATAKLTTSHGHKKEILGMTQRFIIIKTALPNVM